MANLSTLAVTNASPSFGATLTFNAAAVDCTPSQLRELQRVLNKLVTSCTASEGQSPANATVVTLPTGF